MRKAIFYLFCPLLFLSCGGGDDGGGDTASGGSEFLNVSDIEIAGDKTTATLSIQASNNCQWVVSWNDSWIRKVTPTTGRGSQDVTITVDINPSSTASRTAIVTVKNTSGTITRNITLTQSPNEEKLELSVSSLNFTNSASSQEVTITSNTHWTITGLASWVSLNKTEGDKNGSVSVSVSANSSESVRNAILTVTGNNGTSRQLTIVQAARSTDFSVTPTNIAADATASTVSFNIIGEARWTAQSNQGWAVLSDVSGEGSKTVTIALQDNTTEQARSAEIVISSTTKTEKVNIRQTAGSIPVISSVTCTNVTNTGAMVSFSYQSIFPVTEYGVCYSATNPTPSLDSDAHTSQSGIFKQGTPTFNLTELNTGTTYHIRAFATNVVGIRYSSAITVTTPKSWPGGGDNETPNI